MKNIPSEKIMNICKDNPFFIGALVALYLITASDSFAATYYVATNGSDNNTGTTLATPWRHINYAAGKVKAGDKVYVKAGNYGNEQVVIPADGTAGSPILFEGYKNTPGDIVSISWKYGDPLDTSAMPLLDGGDRANGGTGITMYRKYVTVKNFQITNYVVGIDAWGSQYVSLINIVATTFGDINASYSGRGIGVGSQAANDTIRSCIVVNAAAEGFSITGDGNVVDRCKAYCDDNSTGVNSAMDYYIHVAGNYNLVTGCYVERVGNLAHGGHGIDLKTTCEHNKIINCEAVNQEGESFSVRHRGVKYNVIENCIARGGGGLVARDGASYNIFRKCHTIGSYAVEFYDTSEDGGTQWAGSQNTFENCIFENSPIVIDFDSYDRDSYADSNTFVNCTITGGDYLFRCDRTNAANKMINCIVTGITNYKSGSYSLGFSYAYSDFSNNGFAAPAGTGNITSNPSFVSSTDYHLTSGSPCIDSGTPTNAPTDDFDGTARPQGAGYDLGAYEYKVATGIEENSENALIRIFPNPFADEFKLEVAQSVELKSNPSIRIYDVCGKEIRNIPIKSKETIIDRGELENGIYFYSVFSNNEKFTSGKLIVR